MISVIHPSRGRAEKAIEAAADAATMASNESNVQYIFSIDTDDPKEPEYTNQAEQLWSVIRGQNNGCVSAINRAARLATGDILMVMSDDFELCEGWDEIILDAVKDAPPMWMLKTFDGQQPWIATMPIMSRALYERLGYIYHPAYRHMFADTDLSAMCDLMGVTIYRTDILFKHNHYTTGATKPDAVNDAANATWKSGQRIYAARHFDNYGLKPSEIVGEIQSKEHLKWIKANLRP